MSEKENLVQIDSFYTSSHLSQVTLDQQSFKGVKYLGSYQGSKIFGVKRDKDLWDLLQFNPENQVLMRWKFQEPIQAKPFFIDHENDYMLFYQSVQKRLICMSISDRTKQISFPLTFKPSVALTLIPHLDATLILGKGDLGSSTNQYIVFMNQQRQPLPQSQSLSLILRPYSHIHSISHFQSSSDLKLALAVTHKATGKQSILIIGLRDAPQQEGRKQFTVIDQVRDHIGDKVELIQFISEEQIIVVSDGYQITKVQVCQKEGTIQKIQHKFNFFRVKDIGIITENQIVIQDATNEIYVFQDSIENGRHQVNQFYHTSENLNPKLMITDNQVLVVSQSSLSNTTLNIEEMLEVSVEDTILKLFDLDPYTALTIMRSTGHGKQLYLKYQFNKTGCGDPQAMINYLKESKETCEELIQMLKDTSNLTTDTFQVVLEEASRRCPEDDDELFQRIVLIKQRLNACKDLEEQRGKPILSLPEFCIILPFTRLVSEVINSHLNSTHSIQDSLSLLFKSLDLELVLNYDAVIKELPLEFLEPQFVLRYLPPGTSPANQFWQLYYQLNDQDSLDGQQLYIEICQEYIEELNQPGKALIIIQEAAQKRGIQNLTQIGIRAVNRNFSTQKDFHLKQLISGKDQSFEIDLGFIQEYFDKAKWIYVMDNSYYKTYIQQLKDCINNINQDQGVIQAAQFMISLVEFSSQQLMFLKDQDLCQLIFTILYDSDAFTLVSLDKLQQIYHRLQELTLSSNQSHFLRSYLQLHLQLLSDFTLENVSLRQLMQIQSNPDPESSLVITGVTSLINQIVDSKINKTKNVQEHFKAFSQQEQNNSQWITTLQEILQFKENLAPKSQIDVYSIFLRKLLDNRVTSSIEQLIKAEVFPIDELQNTVIHYLQDQYNTCESDHFYNFGQTSMQFLQLLKKYDPENKYSSKLAQEMNLLELTFYLKQQNILFGQLSNAQIRNDYVQDRIIERCLQVHGFSEYPEQFEILIEIQKIIDESKLNQVIVKVLKHLNSIKVFENYEQRPQFIPKMMQQLIINRNNRKEDQVDFSWINQEGIANIIFKISLICPDDPTLKRDLLKFLVTHCDRRNDLFYFVCQQLLPLKPSTFVPLSLIDQLKQALQQGLLSKVKLILMQHFGSGGNVGSQHSYCLDIYCSLIENEVIDHAERKLLAKVMNIQDNEVLHEQLKQLKVMSGTEVARLIRDQVAYSEYVNSLQKKKANRKILEASVNTQETPQLAENQEQSQLPIFQLINAKDVIDAQMIIDMEYTDWNQSIDINKILLEMQESHNKNISEVALEAILDKMFTDSNSERLNKLKDLHQQQFELNILLLAQDLWEQSQSHLDNLLTSQETGLIKNFRQVVSDTNLLKLSMSLEDLDSNYPVYLAACLYANKLEVFSKNYQIIERMSSQNIQRMFYQLIDKDTLEEIIDTSSDTPIVSIINKKYLKLHPDYRQDLIKVLMIQ